ncbi:hypothetical protein PF010_g4904 [Phytophthora fragariae]|uniref:RxLR effector protein n=1 Tax=Phytophthora fragariae TaxID=53985 RepID=A0A6G0LQJ6_9STRA|nr:hypothetical protein PF010_g4904 [Phytophthora fragariae]
MSSWLVVVLAATTFSTNSVKSPAAVMSIRQPAAICGDTRLHICKTVKSPCPGPIDVGRRVTT